jgi:gp43
VVCGFRGDAGAGNVPVVEERCTLTHKLVHAEHGPFPRWLTAREEAAVNAEAARRLILLDALGEALAWSLYPAVVPFAVLTKS